VTPALCATCGSSVHATHDCDDVGATFTTTGVESLGPSPFDLTRAHDRAGAFARAPMPAVKRAVACGVLRLRAFEEGFDGGSNTIVVDPKPGPERPGKPKDLGSLMISARCEHEAFKIDEILCPPRLEESLALEGVSVDGEDRMALLFANSPPPLWALRRVKLDVKPATLGGVIRVRLVILVPCHPEVALTGRIVQ